MISPEVQAAILLALTEGLSIRQICKGEGMPAPSSVYLELTRNPTFAEQYARAREAQMEKFAEEILEIADDSTNDWRERENGTDEINSEHIQRSRLRVDSRKWLMSKLAPKKYGDRVTQEHVGSEGGPLVVTWGGPAPKAAGDE